MNFKEFLNNHIKTKSDISIGSVLFSKTIPYGVINTENKLSVTSIEEKPVYNYLCNAGIYIFSPNVFNYLNLSKKLV